MVKSASAIMIRPGNRAARAQRFLVVTPAHPAPAVPQLLNFVNRPRHGRLPGIRRAGARSAPPRVNFGAVFSLPPVTLPPPHPRCRIQCPETTPQNSKNSHRPEHRDRRMKRSNLATAANSRSLNRRSCCAKNNGGIAILTLKTGRKRATACPRHCLKRSAMRSPRLRMIRTVPCRRARAKRTSVLRRPRSQRSFPRAPPRRGSAGRGYFKHIMSLAAG